MLETLFFVIVTRRIEVYSLGKFRWITVSFEQGMVSGKYI